MNTRADPSAPTTNPAVQTSILTKEESAPVVALQYWWRCIDADKQVNLAKYSYCTSEDGPFLAAGALAALASTEIIERTIVKKLGEDALREYQSKVPPAGYPWIAWPTDQYTVSLNDTHAHLKPPGWQGRPIQLVLVKGQWKVDIDYLYNHIIAPDTNGDRERWFATSVVQMVTGIYALPVVPKLESGQIKSVDDFIATLMQQYREQNTLIKVGEWGGEWKTNPKFRQDLKTRFGF